LPKNRHIDERLIGGAAIFGVGWGVAGICPGPGLVLVGMGLASGMIFCLAMLAGMAVFEAAPKPRASPEQNRSIF
jgi:uncharacterized protein